MDVGISASQNFEGDCTTRNENRRTWRRFEVKHDQASIYPFYAVRVGNDVHLHGRHVYGHGRGGDGDDSLRDQCSQT